MDIPKIYLRKLSGGAFSHDAVDGQQRLRALWEFRGNNLRLEYAEPLAAVAGDEIAGRTFAELSPTLQKRFDGFKISVAEIVSGTSDDIAALFARLQMGVALNPAELRNAILRPLSRVMASIAESHPFFLNGRISSARSKHLDYVTHGFAVLAHGANRDLKAPDLRQLIMDYGPADTDAILELGARAGAVLNVLDAVNVQLGYSITQKWLFTDIFWLIAQRQAAGAAVDHVKLAKAITAFEARRRAHNAHPDTLLSKRSKQPSLDRHLYDYIVAFKSQGGLKENLRTRNEALRAFAPDIDVRE